MQINGLGYNLVGDSVVEKIEKKFIRNGIPKYNMTPNNKFGFFIKLIYNEFTLMLVNYKDEEIKKKHFELIKLILTEMRISFNSRDDKMEITFK